MARIADTKVKESSGAYRRLFGINALGDLMSRVQSAVISSGTELERLILNSANKIENLDEFLRVEIMDDGVVVATKRQIKQSTTLKFREAEPDFLIFKRRDGRQACYVVELKDGHLFDTKKAAAERDAMHKFIAQNGQHIPYKISAHFCCFNQQTCDAIVAGFKQKITRDEAMTGQEFCDLLEIEYDEIISARQREQPANVRFFLRELIKIKPIRDALRELIRNKNGPDHR